MGIMVTPEVGDPYFIENEDLLKDYKEAHALESRLKSQASLIDSQQETIQKLYRIIQHMNALFGDITEASQKWRALMAIEKDS